jgi:hydrogenase expression/formation protein HypE
MPNAHDLAPRGKIHAGFFERVIAQRLGRKSERVLVGPRTGVDAGVLDLGGGQVMVVTTDPLFVVPEYGWERAGWFAVHILASDVATSGFTPQFMTADLNLPLSMTEAQLEALWESMHHAADDLGMSIVTGHTGRYDGCGYPMVGGSTVFSIGPSDGYVSVGMTRTDDAVIVTKGAAVEAAGLMAVTFGRRLTAVYGSDFARRAEEIFWQMSTVRDAMAASRVGVRDRGVTAMHDATEGGVFGGLCEMAEVAGVGMDIDLEAIPVADDVRAICQHFSMDPYTSISEGTLLVTCRPERAKDILKSLGDEGIPAARVGTCSRTPQVRLHQQGRQGVLDPPRVDPFWEAFARAAAES